jgi:hypothetical protein
MDSRILQLINSNNKSRLKLVLTKRTLRRSFHTDQDRRAYSVAVVRRDSLRDRLMVALSWERLSSTLLMMEEAPTL